MSVMPIIAVHAPTVVPVDGKAGLQVNTHPSLSVQELASIFTYLANAYTAEAGNLTQNGNFGSILSRFIAPVAPVAEAVSAVVEKIADIAENK